MPPPEPSMPTATAREVARDAANLWVRVLARVLLERAPGWPARVDDAINNYRRSPDLRNAVVARLGHGLDRHGVEREILDIIAYW